MFSVLSTSTVSLHLTWHWVSQRNKRLTINRTLPPILGSPGSLQILPLQLPKAHDTWNWRVDVDTATLAACTAEYPLKLLSFPNQRTSFLLVLIEIFRSCYRASCCGYMQVRFLCLSISFGITWLLIGLDLFITLKSNVMKYLHTSNEIPKWNE